LNVTERAFFDEHGWLVVRGALDAGELSALVKSFDQVFPELLFAHAQAGQVWQVLGAARQHPSVEKWLHHPALARRAAALLGATRVQLLQDTFLCKPPKKGGIVDWHQDYVYTGYLDPPRSASVRLALTACTAESGCLQVVDGSHRWGWQARPSLFNDDRVRSTLDQLPPELREKVAPDTRTLELQPGDLTVHHCLTLHSSLPNGSAQPRKTIIAHLFDGDCRLKRERLPPGAETHFVTDGDDHFAASAFPVLFSASSEAADR
jgi:ectoine hydroxylase-related dioxygenase (phytanoyl-CoA dioxygenase family)